MIVAVTLTGCSSTSMLNVPQDPRAELQVWLREPPGSAAARTADPLVKAFSARTGYKAQLTALYENFETKLQQQVAYRQLPDAVIKDTEKLGSIQRQDCLVPVDQATFRV